MLDLFYVPATFAEPMTTLTSITPQQLRRAADIQERIFSLQQELSSLLESDAGTVPVPSYGGRAGRRRLSAAGLANIRAGARRRWAKFRAAGGGARRKTGSRRMGAAQKARLSAIAKARWAKAKASGRDRL